MNCWRIDTGYEIVDNGDSRGFEIVVSRIVDKEGFVEEVDTGDGRGFEIVV